MNKRVSLEALLRRRQCAGAWSQRFAMVLLLLSCMMTTTGTVRAADGPTIIRPRTFVSVWQNWQTYSPTTKKFTENMTSWIPGLKFTVQGPVSGGSQFVVDFTKPNGAAWVSVDCPTEEIKADQWLTVVTPRDTSTETEKKFTNGTGVFGFKIRLKNELSGQNQVLYNGKFKVGKVSRFNGTPVTKNKNDFYVDHDWVMPFGYLWLDRDRTSASLESAFWFKGQGLADLAGYVFYKGKQVASTKESGSTGTTELDARTIDDYKGDPHWELRQITWYQISESKEGDTPNPALHYLDKNPGEYEIKILRGGKLCRQAKFTVGDDGKIVDNRLNAVDKLNTNRMVIPVSVVGTTDGTWKKDAWKTEAFYGNPVAGFTAP